MSYAYVFLVMKGDTYVPGVVCAAESIRKNGSLHDIVCMVTPDVSERARLTLQLSATVIEIPYMRYESKPMMTARQMELYESWFSESYTKWYCLNFTQYKKILFIDADMLILQSLDHLFGLEAPAATFSTPWAREFDPESEFGLTDYPTEHGSTVSHENIGRALRSGGYTFIASLVLLEPSTEMYNRLVTIVESRALFDCVNYSTPDEQSLSLLYCDARRNWTFVHQKYNFIIHKLQWLTTGDRCTVPHALHYFSTKKPWGNTYDFARSPWNTDRLWWYFMWSKYQSLDSRGRELIDSFISPVNLSNRTIEDFVQKNTTLNARYFPWLSSLKVRYPQLF